MILKLTLAVSVSALAIFAAPAAALQTRMPGMTMPKPSKPTTKKKAEAHHPRAKKKSVDKKAHQDGTAAKRSVPVEAPAAEHPHPAPAQKEPDPMQGMAMPMEHGDAHVGSQPMTMPAHPETPILEGPAPMDHSQMDHSAMTSAPPSASHGATGALGPYPVSREASGTAWQPDSSSHQGIMRMTGDWMLMGHGVLNLVHDHQGGPSGDDKTFVSGMAMGMARRPIGNGTLQFKAMVSPDPLMGKRGYPLLLASGETADGSTRLVDRQHPHDFVMELSASVSQNIGSNSSLFLYGGLPGEPAFGPPAFMHREAIMDSPEAPISHHWLDSTHISFGVVTAGLVLDRAKIEISRFNGREPDQHRWNIETGPLDSTAVRVSWNPTPDLALQGSWGHFEDPEQLEPGVDQKRWSASALYAREIAPGLKFAGTLAWGRKTVEHHSDDAFAAEASLNKGGWTAFARGEVTENRELLPVGHGPTYRVGKVSLGAVRDFRIAEHVKLGAGGLVGVNFVPNALEGRYGDSTPVGAMAFLRLKMD
jgi:hypothetical protein